LYKFAKLVKLSFSYFNTHQASKVSPNLKYLPCQTICQVFDQI